MRPRLSSGVPIPSPNTIDSFDETATGNSYWDYDPVDYVVYTQSFTRWSRKYYWWDGDKLDRRTSRAVFSTYLPQPCFNPFRFLTTISRDLMRQIPLRTRASQLRLIRSELSPASETF